MRSFRPVLQLFLIFTSSLLYSLSISFVAHGTVVIASDTATIESETELNDAETASDADADADADVDVTEDEEVVEEVVDDEEDAVQEEESIDTTEEEAEEVSTEEEKEEAVVDEAESKEDDEEVLDLDEETTEIEEELVTQETVEETVEEDVVEETTEAETPTATETETETEVEVEEMEVKQSGPFIDLLGETLVSLEMIDDSHAQMRSHLTNDALKGKKVVGLYFSADWCGPCRQFTPELVSFYEKMNSRRGKQGEFEIVWISRCRDFNAFGQYFTHMPWLAMQPELAMGEGGQALSNKYKVKGIPTLVLLDEEGNVITTDARNKVPADRAGIGFPWRNPVASLYINLVPKALRLLVKSSLRDMKRKIVVTIKGALGLKVPAAQMS